MDATNRTKRTNKKDFTSFLNTLAIKTVTSVFGILIFLSLFSHNPEDTHILEKGVGEYATINNWIGLFGAHASRFLILWLGFASYIGASVILLCITARIFNGHCRPVKKIYLLGIFMVTLGSSMLLGVFPDFLPLQAERINMSQTPGGVIGQRFCAPWSVGTAHGWLTWIVNPTGSIIISASMILVGVVTIWFFDWQDRAVYWWHHFIEWKKFNKRQNSDITKPGTKNVFSKRLRPESLSQEHANQDTKAISNSLDILSANDSEESIPGQRIDRKNRDLKSGNSVSNFQLPSVELLTPSSFESTKINPDEIDLKKEILQDTLDSFSIDATVGNTTSGPRVTLFEIKPAAGVKVERISSLANNIAMNLKAESLRILTPIPGKDTVGIEVPNRLSSSVSIRDLFEQNSWKKTQSTIPLVLGMSISGKPIILDLAKAPHLLIAGATGSGKSVCMNTLILSMLYRFSPEDLNLIMIDPKVVEFSGYNTLPHLVTPVVTQVKKVPAVLRWVLNQMEWRYDILSKVGVRNIASFNARKLEKEPILDDERNPIPQRLPFLIVIIDELADIMMTAKADVETSLARIAQLARAVGIHAIVATQRPSVNVITGIIKANFPTRIAFQVTSVVDSRTILDGKGAEALLGRGDMLFKPPGGSKLERTQGAMVDDEEIERVVAFVSNQSQPEFIEDILTFGSSKEESIHESIAMVKVGGDMSTGDKPETDSFESPNGDETLIQKAISIILRDRRATTSHIQRRLRIGYNRAALIIEKLEERGVIGPQIGTAPRQILIETENTPQNNSENPFSDTDAIKS